ncbi:MAE_28990/MAE_18760 family HEPN-like nuclease [Nocardia vaccinii]|uniref:MAE_28990/MAE_18760 family HEPN-like nuclease n=1 Tax=Nocardia vaccinii TaxID=1822 RepID=UPI0008354F98|nr:MAE_28990/MAE_18760 family HEPN-like nuclease [Nocardia vaccinii]
MKIRTVDQLFDRIADDQAWRKKEMSIFAAQAAQSRGAVQAALIRPMVALLYAHWEGFIKNSIHFYLLYLSSLNLPLDDLRDEIVAVCMRNRIRAASPAQRIGPHVEVIRFLRKNGIEPATIPIKKEDIDTESNLSSPVLKDLLLSIGCIFTPYEKYRDLIDDQLVSARNKIAHGESHYIELSEWDDLRKDILMIMDDIALQIVDSANLKSYLAKKQASD